MSRPHLHILCTKRLVDVPLMVEQKATRIAFQVTKGPRIPNPYPDLLYAETRLLDVVKYEGPYVVFNGGNYWTEWKDQGGKIEIVEGVMRRALKVICISKFLADTTRRKVSIDNVVNLPGGLWGTNHVGYKVNSARFTPKTDWKIKGRPRVCMSISLGYEIKYRGIPLFLGATKKVVKKHGVSLICVGRVKSRGKVARKWRARYGLKYKSWKRKGGVYDFTAGLGDRDWPRILSASDVFVHPSMFDTWGCTIADSMMSAVPALVFNRTGCPEVGENVQLVDPAGPKEIAQEFERLLTDEEWRESMAKAALKESRMKTENHKGDFAKLLLKALEGS